MSNIGQTRPSTKRPPSLEDGRRPPWAGSLAVLGDQCAGLSGQLRTVDVLALDFVDPVGLHRRGGAPPALRFLHVQRHDVVARLLGDGAAGLVAIVHGATEHGGGLDARVLVDDGLQVGRQLLVSGLVHGEGEGLGIQAFLAGEGGVVLHQFAHLQRGRHFPGNGGAVDNALGQRLGDGRHRHAHGRGAQFGEHVVDDPRASADLHAAQAFQAGDGRLGVEQARPVGVHGDELDVLELVGGELLDVLLDGARGGLGAAAHEGQFEDFRLGEAAGGVAQHGPGEVDDAVPGLVEQLRRRAAQLHGVEQLHLDAAARFGFHLLRPGREGTRRDGGLRRQHLVQPQRDRLRHGVARHRGRGHRAQHRHRGASLQEFHRCLRSGCARPSCSGVLIGTGV